MDTGKFPRAWEWVNLGSTNKGRKTGGSGGREGKKKGLGEDLAGGQWKFDV